MTHPSPIARVPAAMFSFETAPPAGRSIPHEWIYGLTVELPLRIESTANLREHWAKRAKRTKGHRAAAMVLPKHPLPCIVTLTRIAPRPLDTDNLSSGFKALRDGIADRLGVADNDPRVEWRYAQMRTARPKHYAVLVQIEPMP